MKKLLLVFAALLGTVSLVCNAQAAGVITVGASPTPHAEILAEAAKLLKPQGYELKIVEYSDYVQPNVALDSKELYANYFQHKPYLDDFNAQKGTRLGSMGPVHYEPFGIYAGKSKSLKDLKNGALVAVPNDATNEGRALLLMQDEGLVKLKKDAGLTATRRIRALPGVGPASPPIIAMTAHAMRGDWEKSLAGGMNDHLTKPIDPRRLFAVLEHWLGR